MEAEVAEVGADHVLNLGKHRAAPYADHGTRRIELVEGVLYGFYAAGLVEANVDGGKNAARDRQQMGCELDLVGGEVELLQELAGVAMAEDSVGREIVGGVHETVVGRESFARAGDAGFGVGDDADVEVDHIRAEQGSEREDDGGGVAAGVRDEIRCGDGRAVELGVAVDGGLLERVGGGCVFELVDGAVGRVLQPPGGGEIDNLDAVGECYGCELAGLLVGCGEKEKLDAFALELFPVKWRNA